MTKKRALGIWALIVVASLLLVGTTASLWVKRQALDTTNWVNAADEALDDPAVQTALATYLVDQLYANVDVEAELANQLPDDLQGLAGPISAALRQPATAAVEWLLDTDQVQQVWHTANEVAHRKLVDVLEDKGTFVSTGGGTVTLELNQVVVALGEQLGIPQAALDKIPADAGNIELVQSSQLDAAQTAVKLIRWMSLLLGLVVIALYALAVYLAKGDRRRTLRNVGWSVFVVAVVLAVVRRVTGNWILSLSSDASLTPAIRALYGIGSELLKNLTLAIGLWGLAIVLGCVVAGPTRAAVWVRRTIAPVLNRKPGEVAVGVGVLYLLLLLWSPTPGLQTWPSVLGLAVLVGVGTWLLRNRTLAEFPEATLEGSGDAARERIGSFWSSLTGTVRGWGAGRGGDGDAAELERLAALHEGGKLSDDEFAAAKAKLLG